MIEFKEYESKPIYRKAYKIQKEDIPEIVMTGGVPQKCTLKGVVFVAYEEIKAGDFIIYLDDTDVYHCRRSVFLARNVVEED